MTGLSNINIYMSTYTCIRDDLTCAEVGGVEVRLYVLIRYSNTIMTRTGILELMQRTVLPLAAS
jgi:hypothetical protein